MEKKFFISKIAVGIGMLVLVLSCDLKNNKSKIGEAGSCMDHVLSIDDSLGYIRNHACEEISLSETIQDYVSGLQKVDFEQCPPDFEKAFNDHLQAWKTMTVITDKYPNIRGEMHELFDELEQSQDSLLFNQYLTQIWNTWEKVETSKKFNND